LHDGLGPKLAAQTLKLEAALDSLDRDPETTRQLLADMMTESQSVVVEIRRLVYGLRPPALDELGLRGAVAEQAARYSLNGLQVTVSAPDSLPPLP
jgi:signal transduction histidine kinase